MHGSNSGGGSIDNNSGMSSSRLSTDSLAGSGVEPIVADPRLANPEDERAVGYNLDGDTFSVSSSIYDYRCENGRTYHRYKDGAYLMPNDEIEKDRLDLVHHMYLILLGGRLTLAPIGNPARVLDIGTGTGIWAIALADQLPETSQIIGTDLSPIQPEWVPPNCRFEIDDAESEWTFPENHFDFIHSRHLNLSMRDWKSYVERLYRHTAPGGFVELVEHNMTAQSDDGTYPAGCPVHVYIERLAGCAMRAGFLTHPAPTLKRLCREAGFVDLQHTAKKLPWGPWAEDETLRELGQWARLVLKTGLEAYAMALLTRVGGYSSAEVAESCRSALEMLNDRRTHIYNYHHFIVARKPNIGEDVRRPGQASEQQP